MFKIIKLEKDEFAVITESEQIQFYGDEFEVMAYLYNYMKIAITELNAAFDDLIDRNYRIAEFGINYTYTIAV